MCFNFRVDLEATFISKAFKNFDASCLAQRSGKLLVGVNLIRADDY